MKCEDCSNEFEIKPTTRYTRKFPNKCPLCALKNTPNKSYSNPTHGHRSKGKRDKLYTKWVQMRGACYSEKSKDYRLVGAKGIKMHSTWLKYPGFLKWAQRNGYKDGMTFRRLDKTKDFCPDNCVFIKGKDTLVFKIQNEVHTVKSIHKRIRSTIPLKNVQDRLSKKWTLTDALLNPFGYRIYGKRRKKTRGAKNA